MLHHNNHLSSLVKNNSKQIQTFFAGTNIIEGRAHGGLCHMGNGKLGLLIQAEVIFIVVISA